MNLLSTATGAGFAALGAYGASQGYQSKANANLSNIEAALTLRSTQATIFEAQDREIQERLGQQLTRDDLETLKAEGRLRAAQAETGTSGGTSDLAVAEAYVVGARNRETTIQSAKDQRLNLARRNIMSRLDNKMRIQKYMNDIPTAQEITAGIFAQSLSGLSSGLNLGRNITGYMKEDERALALQKQTKTLAAWERQKIVNPNANIDPNAHLNNWKGW